MHRQSSKVTYFTQNQLCSPSEIFRRYCSNGQVICCCWSTFFNYWCCFYVEVLRVIETRCLNGGLFWDGTFSLTMWCLIFIGATRKKMGWQKDIFCDLISGLSVGWSTNSRCHTASGLSILFLASYSVFSVADKKMANFAQICLVEVIWIYTLFSLCLLKSWKCWRHRFVSSIYAALAFSHWW